ANVFFAILSGKSKPKSLGKLFTMPFLEPARRGVQSQANVVAVEHKASQSARMELMVHEVSNRALAASAQAREPNHATLMTVELFTFGSGYAVLVPMQVDLFVVHGIAALLPK